MKVSVHSCLLDRECRSHGVPGFTYLTLGTLRIRFNPPYSRRKYFGESRWTWRVVQTWRKGS